MSDFKLDFEWESSAGAQGPELRSTWARLRISVGSETITRVEDRSSRSVRDGIYLPLYPLAEWLAANWWALLYEIAAPRRISGNGYTHRHLLSAASEGYALPPLKIQPEGRTVNLMWEPVDLPDCRLHFLSRGSAYLERDQLEEALRKFVRSVVGRLEDQGLDDTFLSDEWRAIENADPEERLFCQAAGALGWDPYDLREDDARSLIEGVKELPSNLTEEFLATADPRSLVQQARAIVSFVSDAAKAETGLAALKDLRGDIDDPAALNLPPWDQGYAAARRLRERLGLNGCIIDTPDSLGKALKEDPASWKLAIEARPELRFLEVLVAITKNGSPRFAVDRSHSPGQTFALSRALFEYLNAPEGAASLVTASYSERQKRNRAFAAEFLVPAHLLRQRLGPVVTEEEIEELAQKFGVSSYVVRHQIENHRLAHLARW